jgi:hypothetical protein
LAVSAIAGITTSPQFRESPEATKRHVPPDGCCAMAGSIASVNNIVNIVTATANKILRIMVPPGPELIKKVYVSIITRL